MNAVLRKPMPEGLKFFEDLGIRCPTCQCVYDNDWRCACHFCEFCGGAMREYGPPGYGRYCEPCDWVKLG